jgi:hypothetical protein
MNTSLVLIIIGGLAILVASVLEAFCAFGRDAREDVKPAILKTPMRWALETVWVVLLLGGGVSLLLVSIATGLWIVPLAGIFGFWLVLPFLITPIMRYRLLPEWDEVKKELEPKGYTQKDYWRGDWWMVPKKQKKSKLKQAG